MTDVPPASGHAPIENPPAVAPDKGRRKTHAKRESAASNQATDSQTLYLEAVEPNYHELAKSVCQAPKAYNGQLVWLAPQPGSENPNTIRLFEPPAPLSKASRVDLLMCFQNERAKRGLKLGVILYIRVSSDMQALMGGSLKAMCIAQLEKCARYGLQVLAIGIDVESGTVEDRIALSKVMEAIHSGRARCLVVPVISRLERNEANFAVRMSALGDCESWVLFGQTYEDKSFEYVYWYDFDSRERAVSHVRRAELYIKEMKDSITSTEREKLKAGLLISPLRKNNFVLYNIVNLVDADSKRPNSQRRIDKQADCVQQYAHMKQTLFAGRDAKDPDALERYLKEQGKRIGQNIAVDEFEWEMRLGLVIGRNRRSPGAPEEHTVKVPDLAIETSKDETQIQQAEKEYYELLEAIDDIKALRRKQHTKALNSDRLDEYRKAQLAEAQQAAGERIAYRLTCNCHDTLTQVLWVGDVPGKTDEPRDWVICPKCSLRVSGNPDKQRMPRKKHFNAIRGWAEEACNSCTRYGRVKKLDSVFIGKMEFPVFECLACARQRWRGAAKVHGQGALETNEAAREAENQPEGPTQSPPNQHAGTNPPVGAITKGASDLDKSMRNRRTYKPAQNAPSKAPPGVARTMWEGPLPPGPDFAKDLTPVAVANRMADALIQHGMTYCFHTTQLRSFGLGRPVDHDLDILMRQKANKGQFHCHNILRERGFELKVYRVPKTWLYIYWVEGISQEGPSQAAKTEPCGVAAEAEEASQAE